MILSSKNISLFLSALVLNRIIKFGLLSDNVSSEEKNVLIYPNPANEFFNISIEDPTIVPDKIRLIDLSGKIVFEGSVTPGIITVYLPPNLRSGIYIVELTAGSIVLDAQKIIINRTAAI